MMVWKKLVDDGSGQFGAKKVNMMQKTLWEEEVNMIAAN